MFSQDDHRYMAQALRLAEQGLYTASPNPRVGCVIVKEDKIVGQGWHERAGLPHAEINALKMAGENARGATVYITLEPCNHQGQTGPCSDALIQAAVGRVVAALQDPNPLVNGGGLKKLAHAGIRAEQGILEDEARELNVGFVSRMVRGRPWVRVKIAASLDGKTSLNNGNSRWITGEPARQDAHRWRARSCAILTGAGTIRDDDPQLTVRHVETPRQPLRVVVDSKLEITPAARVLQGGALVFCAVDDKARIAALTDAGVKVIVLPNREGKVELGKMMQMLAQREVNEVLVEAGYRLNGSLLEAGLVDELLIYVAPHLLGDKARGMFELPELKDVAGRRELKILDLRMVGPDLRMQVRFAEVG
ncbi:MAG TPA: bifunctional diaminohydroxyphosphoribosylaminopyrimidine deaminase/5-amino-6-(5-phosphoribosylamino)uracil reductase RibD [Burkholderiales bacterium]|nr:bifunctional diaminohydroxyphosphoribosylaminopyrimidine deaminase/5-amino-6-(5-phosphoribosylamino)uracil reductase RibD [Burkholderiales bacterium]